MAQYTVDSDQLVATVGTAQGQIDSVQNAASDLTTTLGALEGSWTGQASVAFQDSVVEWRGVQSAVETAAFNLNQALSMAADHYGSTENDVIRMFS